MAKTTTKKAASQQQAPAEAESKGAVTRIDQFKQEIALREGFIRPMLPAHIPFDKFQSNVIAALGANPKLMDCTRSSLMKATVEAAELGLSLNPALKEADILPVYNRRKSCLEAQLRTRYGGEIKLARQSDQISKIYAHAVREKDAFEYQYGLNKTLRHVPGGSGKRGALTHAYCVWHFKDGDADFVVIDREYVDKIKDRSPSKNKDGKLTGPWITDEEEMWRKTAVHYASKYMPMAAEAFQRAVAIDGAREVGREASIIEGEVVLGDADILPPDSDDTTERETSLDRFEKANTTPNTAPGPTTDAAQSKVIEHEAEAEPEHLQEGQQGEPKAEAKKAEPKKAKPQEVEPKKTEAQNPPEVEPAPSDKMKPLPMPSKDGQPDWSAWYDSACAAVKQADSADFLTEFRDANAQNIGMYGFSFPQQANDLENFIKDRIDDLKG